MVKTVKTIKDNTNREPSIQGQQQQQLDIDPANAGFINTSQDLQNPPLKISNSQAAHGEDGIVGQKRKRKNDPKHGEPLEVDNDEDSLAPVLKRRELKSMSREVSRAEKLDTFLSSCPMPVDIQKDINESFAKGDIPKIRSAHKQSKLDMDAVAQDHDSKEILLTFHAVIEEKAKEFQAKISTLIFILEDPISFIDILCELVIEYINSPAPCHLADANALQKYQDSLSGNQDILETLNSYRLLMGQKIFQQTHAMFQKIQLVNGEYKQLEDYRLCKGVVNCDSRRAPADLVGWPKKIGKAIINYELSYQQRLANLAHPKLYIIPNLVCPIHHEQFLHWVFIGKDSYHQPKTVDTLIGKTSSDNSKEFIGQIYQEESLGKRLCKSPGIELFNYDENPQGIAVVDFVRVEHARRLTVFSADQMTPKKTTNHPMGKDGDLLGNEWLGRLSTQCKLNYLPTVKNPIIGLAHMINQVCDNTMILSKYIMYRMLCAQLLLTPGAVVSLASGNNKKFSLGKLMVLDNNFKPYQFGCFIDIPIHDIWSHPVRDEHKQMLHEELCCTYAPNMKSAEMPHVFEIILQRHYDKLQLRGELSPHDYVYVIQIDHQTSRCKHFSEFAVVKVSEDGTSFSVMNSHGVKDHKTSFVKDMCDADMITSPLDYALPYLHRHTTDKSKMPTLEQREAKCKLNQAILIAKEKKQFEIADILQAEKEALKQEMPVGKLGVAYRGVKIYEMQEFYPRTVEDYDKLIATRNLLVSFSRCYDPDKYTRDKSILYMKRGYMIPRGIDAFFASQVTVSMHQMNGLFLQNTTLFRSMLEDNKDAFEYMEIEPTSSQGASSVIADLIRAYATRTVKGGVDFRYVKKERSFQTMINEFKNLLRAIDEQVKTFDMGITRVKSQLFTVSMHLQDNISDIQAQKLVFAMIIDAFQRHMEKLKRTMGKKIKKCSQLCMKNYYKHLKDCSDAHGKSKNKPLAPVVNAVLVPNPLAEIHKITLKYNLKEKLINPKATFAFEAWELYSIENIMQLINRFCRKFAKNQAHGQRSETQGPLREFIPFRPQEPFDEYEQGDEEVKDPSWQEEGGDDPKRLKSSPSSEDDEGQSTQGLISQSFTPLNITGPALKQPTPAYNLLTKKQQLLQNASGNTNAAQSSSQKIGKSAIPAHITSIAPLDQVEEQEHESDMNNQSASNNHPDPDLVIEKQEEDQSSSDDSDEGGAQLQEQSPLSVNDKTALKDERRISAPTKQTCKSQGSQKVPPKGRKIKKQASEEDGDYRVGDTERTKRKRTSNRQSSQNPKSNTKTKAVKEQQELQPLFKHQEFTEDSLLKGHSVKGLGNQSVEEVYEPIQANALKRNSRMTKQSFSQPNKEAKQKKQSEK